MIKNLNRFLIASGFAMAGALSFLSANFCRAAFLSPDAFEKMKGEAGKTAAAAGFSETYLGTVIAVIITGFMAFLGIIFIILIILAGWKYMNARGDEGKTTEALDQIRHAVIGLIIIVGAYAVTYFVFNALPWGGTSGPVPH